MGNKRIDRSAVIGFIEGEITHKSRFGQNFIPVADRGDKLRRGREGVGNMRTILETSDGELICLPVHLRRGRQCDFQSIGGNGRPEQAQARYTLSGYAVSAQTGRVNRIHRFVKRELNFVESSRQGTQVHQLRRRSVGQHGQHRGRTTGD